MKVPQPETKESPRTSSARNRSFISRINACADGTPAGVAILFAELALLGARSDSSMYSSSLVYVLALVGLGAAIVVVGGGGGLEPLSVNVKSTRPQRARLSAQRDGELEYAGFSIQCLRVSIKAPAAEYNKQNPRSMSS
ncbi:hypothetical protein MKEN_01418800 [Mycena kentingensis (nom. inval.)]|nr:hypothetical protein MKEN_01418800 [Mycena kentingensis (nom. inval.)]